MADAMVLEWKCRVCAMSNYATRRKCRFCQTRCRDKLLRHKKPKKSFRITLSSIAEEIVDVDIDFNSDDADLDDEDNTEEVQIDETLGYRLLPRDLLKFDDRELCGSGWCACLHCTGEWNSQCVI